MALLTELQAHLDGGATTLCRCWEVRRRDGKTFGFTDHDLDLSFGGVIFRAGTGLSAQAVQKSTGLAANNTEVIGALSDASVTEADLLAGRFDSAEVMAWLVNWQDVSQRHLLCRGNVGEVSTGGGEFRAELRGLSDRLNRTVGRVYQPVCDAALGDAACGVDLTSPAHAAQGQIATVVAMQELVLAGVSGFAEHWFERGSLTILDGPAAGLAVAIKRDLAEGAQRRVTLWQELRAPVSAGAQVRIVTGCDKRFATCRDKFANSLNFRGFPHIPGEDWMMAYPKQSRGHDGGSRNR